jgi:hypothetical protein
MFDPAYAKPVTRVKPFTRMAANTIMAKAKRNFAATKNSSQIARRACNVAHRVAALATARPVRIAATAGVPLPTSLAALPVRRADRLPIRITRHAALAIF